MKHLQNSHLQNNHLQNNHLQNNHYTIMFFIMILSGLLSTMNV
jgi:hypothetical protein